MNNILNRAVWIVMTAPLIYLLIVWQKVPDQIATHFNLRGEADKFGGKNQLLVFVGVASLLGVGIYLLLSNIYRIDPKKDAADNKNRLKKIGFATVVFLSAVECLVIHACTKGIGVKLDIRIVFASMGLFWAVIGNYMNNIKPNYFAGFRLPWTLESEDNWRHTHHVAGKVWFAGGILLTATCIFLPTTFAMFAMVSITLVMTVIPIVYSYRFYRNHKIADTIK